MSYRWAEDDFDLPRGAVRLGSDAPVSGRTYIMYHGTSAKNAQAIQSSQRFKPSTGGMLGPGVYLSRDLKKASRYPLNLPEKDRVVIRVQVDVGKVIAINRQNHPLRKTWHDHGYDTAWVPPNCGMVKSGLEEDCVWDPNRIRILSLIKPKPTHRAVCHNEFINLIRPQPIYEAAWPHEFIYRAACPTELFDIFRPQPTYEAACDDAFINGAACPIESIDIFRPQPTYEAACDDAFINGAACPIESIDICRP